MARHCRLPRSVARLRPRKLTPPVRMSPKAGFVQTVCNHIGYWSGESGKGRNKMICQIARFLGKSGIIGRLSDCYETGLKICLPHGSAGSSPAVRTNIPCPNGTLAGF